MIIPVASDRGVSLLAAHDRTQQKPDNWGVIRSAPAELAHWEELGFLPPAFVYVRAVLQQDLVRPKSEKTSGRMRMERRRIPHFRTEDLL